MIRKKILITTLAYLCLNTSFSQQLHVHEDYVGGGNFQDILISTSSSFSDTEWSDNSQPVKTINGEGLVGRKAEASRFLFQAAFGGTEQQVNALAQSLDFEGWIDEQMISPKTAFLQLTRQIYLAAKDRHEYLNGSADGYEYNETHFQYAWWQAALTKPDILRQRVAFALSEIFVISTDSDIRNDGDGSASYYDLLMTHAFGNYRELLEDVTYHPSMGIYLSHFRNQKTNAEGNIYPDENYAREIMQLFSIGLYELKQNGTSKTDTNGNLIPTYNADDIRNLAKVMTGLGAGALTEEGIQDGRDLNFNTSANILKYTVPMAMYDDYHEEGAKYLMNELEIPAGQTGEDDIDMALDFLFHHPNTPPFMARRLIQQLVKSNPSNAYIFDIAQVFKDNGDGVRGDLGAVTKAILLHSEARECLWMEDPANGKLKSPVARYVQVARNFADRSGPQHFWTSGYTFENETYQLPLSSPSVFNFYLPDYQPNGEIYDNGLYAPEFEIHNSVTSLGFANQADIWARQNRIFNVFDLDYTIDVEKDDLTEYAKDPEVLVNELDSRLCHGQLSQETRTTIINALDDVMFGSDSLSNRADIAFYLTLISPDFAIQK